MNRRFIALGLALFLASPAMAQVQSKTAHFQGAVDLDATSYTYCVVSTQGGPWTAPQDGRVSIKTSGSSATVTAVTAATNPFEQITVGDILYLRHRNDKADIRYVTAKATNDSVTVNTAIDISSGVPFSWQDVTCGTGVTAGWIPANEWHEINVIWQIDQMNATSIDVIIHGRDETLGPVPTTIYPDPADSASTIECKKGNFTAINTCKLVVTGVWDFIRIGFKINTDDGSDTGADAESITASLRGRR